MQNTARFYISFVKHFGWGFLRIYLFLIENKLLNKLWQLKRILKNSKDIT